ncbi:hypothetical protein M2459_001011 [Parabacteroides sp. PF5-5]|uniref:exodeoxyribonuclease X C-terminal domain-containing protein n=1 Tax=unclassified Parabacteroides TaxID=2649774 RepID=UPI0024749BF1|nr:MULTISPECIES: hypothetical protein [unclassified Parabacteroides]MDH6304283.1 hypothetical protein [Parabacteroides sp. PH5-39]MDH6315002.1 hypothetical protein [Parabacteroides sp. PF5-13]MDH6318662.1 hypothetical protein [Parabacteroides sp. PH5-13]MDH6322392.1 hypothetical protein [Parabacteroides sp. PH5-8]MDH6326473.1 hypothetical protein [Parabacteroides sp. PH5-41]
MIGVEIYHLDTPFTFGKYKGQTLAEVFHKDPIYVEWCALNINSFCLSDDAMVKIDEHYGDEMYLSMKAMLLMSDRKRGKYKDVLRYPRLRDALNQKG